MDHIRDADGVLWMALCFCGADVVAGRVQPELLFPFQSDGWFVEQINPAHRGVMTVLLSRNKKEDRS